MSAASLGPAVRKLLRSAADAGPSDLSDPELIRRFAELRDEAAFAALVRRHGPLVFDVCCCVLGNRDDAEDAFQATFLVLARKAGTVRKPESLASWLHGVAYRTARKARVAALRRREHESRTPPREPAEPSDRNWGEVQAILHEELLALPERLRAVLVLCYLEGLTQDRAAEVLGLSKVAVRKRLERGRERLRHRLAARGLGPTAVLAAFALPAAAPAVPPALAEATARIASAGGTTGAAVPAHVLTLAAGGMPMTLGRLATALWLVPALVAGAVLAGAAGQSRIAAEQPAVPSSAISPVGDTKAEPAPNEETPAEKELKWLAGEWKVAFVEVAGMSAFPNADISDARITFKDGKAEVKDFRLLSFGNFSLKLDPTSQPKEIDVTFLEGPWKGDTFVGVYVTMRNEVRICLRLEKTNLGRPRGFSTVADAGLYTFFLRPVDEKGPPPFPPKPPPPPPVNPNPRPVEPAPAAPPAGVLKQLSARLVIPEGALGKWPVVLAPVVQIGNPTAGEVELQFDPKDVEITVADAAGKAVPAGKASPGGPKTARGLIPPGGHVGFPTHGGAIEMDESFNALVVGDRMWVLDRGKYAVKGSVTVTITFPVPQLERGAREAPARLPAVRVKLELKPMTVEIPAK
jgi:RNA polymerase sigma factor (sigma-70 family)